MEEGKVVTGEHFWWPFPSLERLILQVWLFQRVFEV